MLALQNYWICCEWMPDAERIGTEEEKKMSKMAQQQEMQKVGSGTHAQMWNINK